MIGISPPPILITGLHRSGTTWVGRLMEATGEVAVMHEPFNIQHGLRGIPLWYPYHPGGNPDPSEAPFAGTVEALYSDFFGGTARYVRSNSKASLPRRIARGMMGNASERYYRKVFRQSEAHLCLKDPFSLFSVPYLVEKHNARVVILVRHPAVLLLSMRRMAWRPHAETLLKQPGLLVRFGDDISDAAPDLFADEVAANTVFWILAQRWSLSLLKTYPDNVKMFRHEDLSRGSDDAIVNLLDHVHLRGALASAKAFVDETTKGKLVVPKKGILHSEAPRDGIALAESWKTQLDKAEKNTILKLAKSEIHEIYGND